MAEEPALHVHRNLLVHCLRDTECKGGWLVDAGCVAADCVDALVGGWVRCICYYFIRKANRYLYLVLQLCDFPRVKIISAGGDCECADAYSMCGLLVTVVVGDNAGGK